MPVFDIVGFLKSIKNITVKIFSVNLVTALKLATWVFYMSSLALATTIIVKMYNWFASFKTTFESSANGSSLTYMALAKASGALSAFSDLFTTFILILTVFISYKISVYLKKMARDISKDAQDIAMLINS